MSEPISPRAFWFHMGFAAGWCVACIALPLAWVVFR